MLRRHLRRLVALPLQRSGRIVRRPDRRSFLLSRPRLADSVRRSPGAGFRGPRRAALLLHRRRSADRVRARNRVGARVLDDRPVAGGGDDVLADDYRLGFDLGGSGRLPAPCLARAPLLQLPEGSGLCGRDPAPLVVRGSPRHAAADVDRGDDGDRVSVPSRPRCVRRTRDGRAHAVADRAAHGRAPPACRDLRPAGRGIGGAVPALHSAQRRPAVVLPAGVSLGRTRPYSRDRRLARARRQSRWCVGCREERITRGGRAGQRGGVDVLQRASAAVLCALRVGRVPRRVQARLAAREGEAGDGGGAGAGAWMPGFSAARSRRGWQIRRCRS